MPVCAETARVLAHHRCHRLQVHHTARPPALTTQPAANTPGACATAAGSTAPDQPCPAGPDPTARHTHCSQPPKTYVPRPHAYGKRHTTSCEATWQGGARAAAEQLPVPGLSV